MASGDVTDKLLLTYATLNRTTEVQSGARRTLALYLINGAGTGRRFQLLRIYSKILFLLRLPAKFVSLGLVGPKREPDFRTDPH